MSFKQLINVYGELVSVTTEHIFPPIPYRGDDWCAYYTIDQDDSPDCGWGATPEDAIEDLIQSYDYEDKLPSFAELYGIDLFYARMHWQIIDRNYQEIR
jgi:hypothetical protein